MARPKSAFLGALGTAFQIWKAIADAVLEEGGDDDALRRVLTEPDLPKDIALVITGKARIAAREVRAGWNVKKFGDKIVSFKSADGRYYELGQSVVSTNDRQVPTGSKGYIIGFEDPQEQERFVSVLFEGSTEVSKSSPGEIEMV